MTSRSDSSTGENPPQSGTLQDAFLHELPWLRRLALKLTGNSHDADDLAQQAWLQASAGRRPTGSPRSWLSAIARNLHRATHRSERRRAVREAAVPRPEPTPTPDQLHERLDAHRRLLTAVDQLTEPYRSTVTCRYLYGMSVRDIASREELPVKTVETRLRRAHEQLRGRLDGELGGRGAWLALLGPLPVIPPFAPPDAPAAAEPAPIGATTAAAGATLAVTAKLLTTTASIAAVAVVAVFLWPDPAPPELQQPVDTVETPSTWPEPAPETPGQEPTADVTRSEVVAAPTPDEEAEEPAPEPGLLKVLCVDPFGQPVPGIALQTIGGDRPETPLGTTDGEGRLSVPAWNGRVALDPAVDSNRGWVMVLQPKLTAWALDPAGHQRVAVLARSIEVTGTLRSTGGTPLRKAKVEVELPEGWQSRIPHVLSSGEVPNWRATPNATERFSLTAPQVPGALLQATAVGHQPAEIPVPDTAPADIAFTLEPVSQHWTLLGQVADGAGQPLPGIMVVSSHGSARSNAEGRFRLEVDGPTPPDEIHGIGTGWQPHTLPIPEVAPGLTEIGGLQLTMRDKALTITGRVLDCDGDPLPRARVWFGQGTELGWNNIYPVQAERSAAGSDLMWYTAHADDEGRFTLEGLLDKPYRIHAAHPHTTLETASPAPIPAGTTGVELRLDSSQARGPVTGVVVDMQDQPVADANVGYERTGSLVEDRNGQGYISSLRARSVRTDAEGRFEMTGLPRSHRGTLRVGAPGFTGQEVDLLPGEAPSPLRITLFRECRIHVDLRDPGLGDSVSFSGPDGKPLQVLRITSDVHYIERRSKLVDGRVTLQVAGNAVAATLWKDGEKVTSTTLSLAGAAPMTLRF